MKFLVCMVFVFCSIGFALPVDDVYVESDQRLYVSTNKGDFYIKLFSEDAPQAVQRIRNLVKLGMYNGVLVSSAETGYYVQIDDIRNRTAPLLQRQKNMLKPIFFEDSGYSHEAGLVSLTQHDGKNYAESAMTIMMGPSPDLDGQQTIIGEIEKGMATLNLIQNLPTDEHQEFKEPVRIMFAGLLSPEVAAFHYAASQNKNGAYRVKKYALFSFLAILLITGVIFFFYGKLGNRNVLSLTMMVFFVSVFASIILVGDQIVGKTENSLGGLALFFCFVALFKFLNRFESQPKGL